jgi:cytosine deaminase
MGEPWVPLPEARDVEGRIAADKRVFADPARRPAAERAAALVRSAVSFGTTAIRSHVDVTPALSLANVEALLEVRHHFAGLVQIQLVAFPQDGVLRRPGTSDLLEQALKLGCEVLGGIDPGGIDGDVEGQLNVLFRLASKHDVRLDIHLHDPGHLGGHQIARIAARTIAEGMRGRVAISHAYALGELPEAEAARLTERLAAAEITIVTHGAVPRQPPRIPELWAAGVPVAFGNDNVHDAWWPYGRGDMLERASLAAYRSALRTDPELRRALHSATMAGAALLGLGRYGIAPGARADLVLVDGQCAPEAVAAHPPRLAVIKAGRIVLRDESLSRATG